MSTDWIPEPPTTPEELAEAREEHGRAIALQAVLLVAAAVLFLLFTLPYEAAADFTRWGRENDLTGLFERFEREYVEDADRLQEHRILWLVGASIIKQGANERALNNTLERTGSDWRVRKNGFARGAPLLAAGVIDRLPLKPGDHVVSAVWFSNYRHDWMADNDSAEALAPFLLSCGEILQLDDLLWQDRIELCLNHPEQFFLVRDEFNTGAKRLWNHRVLDYNEPSVQWVPQVNKVPHAKEFLREGGYRGGGPDVTVPLSFEPDHVNVLGLYRMRERVLAAGAAFTVLRMPMHPAAEAERMPPEILEAWQSWDGPPGVPFVPVPGDWQEEHFWNYHHLNKAGRTKFALWLLPLLESGGLPAEVPEGWAYPLPPRPEGL